MEDVELADMKLEQSTNASDTKAIRSKLLKEQYCLLRLMLTLSMQPLLKIKYCKEKSGDYEKLKRIALSNEENLLILIP